MSLLDSSFMPNAPSAKSQDRTTKLATILIVDDDGEILGLVARFLRSNGFEVSAAASVRGVIG